ncbi:hypothetical protein ABPG75_007263 [Micractinium tetrahymenae]
MVMPFCVSVVPACSSMAQLGGGGPQTLWGFQLQRAQSGHVALAAGVGSDLPPEVLQRLCLYGIDTGALVLPPDGAEGGQSWRTPRAWQILEEDGRRHEIWRTPFTPQLVRMLRPPLGDVPPAYRLARAYHAGIPIAMHPEDAALDLLRELRAAAAETGGLVSAETFAAAEAAVPQAALSAFMQPLDVFSPNEAEAASMLFGPGSTGQPVPERCLAEPRHLTEPFLEAGAGLVALRRGPEGAVVQEAATGAAWRVPAYPDTQVVDPTGCGNAFCGALLGALLAGESAVSAAAWGCAAGSLMAECVGSPAVAPRELAAEAARRQAIVLSLTAQV